MEDAEKWSDPSSRPLVSTLRKNVEPVLKMTEPATANGPFPLSEYSFPVNVKLLTVRREPMDTDLVEVVPNTASFGLETSSTHATPSVVPSLQLRDDVFQLPSAGVASQV